MVEELALDTWNRHGCVNLQLLDAVLPAAHASVPEHAARRVGAISDALVAMPSIVWHDQPRNELIAPTKPKLEFIVAPELEPPYRVLVHNDDVTPMDFVVQVLQAVFEMPIDRAESIMLTAHHRGVAYVATYSKQEAQSRIKRAHNAARMEGYPLKFTLEPEG